MILHTFNKNNFVINKSTAQNFSIPRYMNPNTEKLSIVEKVGYAPGDLSANLIFQTLITFIAYFYTDIYKSSRIDLLICPAKNT